MEKNDPIIDKLCKILKQYKLSLVPDFITKQKGYCYCYELKSISLPSSYKSDVENVLALCHEIGHHIDSMKHPSYYKDKNPSDKGLSFIALLAPEFGAWKEGFKLFKENFPELCKEKDAIISHATWALGSHYLSRFLPKDFENEKQEEIKNLKRIFHLKQEKIKCFLEKQLIKP